MGTITRVAGALAAATTFTLALPAASALAGPDGGCGKGVVCLYAYYGYNYDGAYPRDLWRDFAADEPYLGDDLWSEGKKGLESGRRVDDDSSSVKNHAGCDVVLWQNPFYTGAHSMFADGRADPFLGGSEVGNNTASSLSIWCV
ncbi:hypothetical protein MTP10_06130 [Nonomuraea sp. 3-1Str]|uniref:hypothetical protein n=1 Tax=Nonomuraea sp. 3-1Str TaxID=2929801 RepID=UPI0028640173|nr:hypothetical protein [Nonomuraea sp. 3-1Str]MDR8408309.1 hypothetical protein [Nonomuraea sp. 3-1Str]